MKKTIRVISMLCVFAMCLSMVILPTSALSYWDLQKQYLKALESGDDNEILRTSDNIIRFYAPWNSDEACSRCISPVKNASRICEKQGKFERALEYYKIHLKCVKYLDATTDGDYYDSYVGLESMFNQYAFIKPTIYVEANNPADVPFYGMKNEPKIGTSVGLCGEYEKGKTNAYLLYVQFFTENISSFSWRLPHTNDKYTLEVAWNVPNETKEDLDKINSGDYDEYIIRNLKYLDTLENCKVLLRFGAEINVWSSLPSNKEEAEKNLPAYKESFKKAFRRISKFAKEYAPETAMVYSPNDISGWYNNALDFYPGDEYVDWVGMSTYQNSSSINNGYGSTSDAFYCRGIYENQIVKIKKIVDAFGNRKPIMISECGFCYSSSDGIQDSKKAAERLEYFYTYVNMVYPQVKAIFHFNTNFGGNKYEISGDPQVKAAYDKAINGNGVIKSTLEGKPTGYTRLDTLCEKRDELKLYTFAHYPGKNKINVTYTFDGKVLPLQSDVSKSVVIDKSKLTEGKHTLKVNVSCLETSYQYEYGIYVSSKGLVSTGVSAMKDVPKGSWAYPYIEYCMQEGLFKGVSPNSFEPATAVTRGMFVTLLGRMEEVDVTTYEEPDFSDVKPGTYYSKYISWAKENKIVQGVTPNTFEPDNSITREQLCTMIVRYCDSVGITLKKKTENKKFADDDQIFDYAKESVYKAKEAGLVEGKGNNVFEPKSKATRAEIAVLLKRFHEEYIK